MLICEPESACRELEIPMLFDMARVLVVEDEEDIAFPLVRTLEREGYTVQWVENGADALDQIKAEPPNMVILDLGLPDIDGLEVCRSARDAGFDGAIMIVTARAGELDRVVGLDYGADDYLAKPFGLAELQARARALLRRNAPRARRGRPSHDPTDDGLRIDGGARRVFAGDEEISLTGKEFEVLSTPRGEPRQGRLPRPADGRRVGRELVRLHQDARRDDRAAAAEAGGASGSAERVVAVRGVGFRLEGATDA